MSRQRALVDRLQRGLGIAARRIGVLHEAYRPSSAFDPLATERRFLSLPVAFELSTAAIRHAPDFGEVMWQGLFDAAYTRPGDYLRGPTGIYFIASQLPLMPVVCVRTNRTVSLSRPARPQRPGVNDYGGVLKASADLVLRNWPVSLLVGAARVGRDDVGLPGDGGNGTFTLLLPTLPAAAAHPVMADLIEDDAGWSYVVFAAEQTAAGWKLTVRQVAS